MANTRNVVIRDSNGAVIGRNPKSINFSAGFTLSESNGVVEVEPAAGINGSLADGKILVGDSNGDAQAVTPSGDVTISNAGVTEIGAGKVTPVMTIKEEARTATTDGLTTGLISVTTTHVTVTSDDANKIITLPASVVGKVITLRNGATGYELRTTAGSSIKMNDVVGGSTNECAIPATALVTCRCVSSTEWVITAVDKFGAVIAALVPDAV